jgi:hypothetical protein
MKYHSLSAGLILAAFVLFLAGVSLAGISVIGALLIIAAAVCELHFWKRTLHRHRRPASQ